MLQYNFRVGGVRGCYCYIKIQNYPVKEHGNCELLIRTENVYCENEIEIGEVYIVEELDKVKLKSITKKDIDYFRKIALLIKRYHLESYTKHNGYFSFGFPVGRRASLYLALIKEDNSKRKLLDEHFTIFHENYELWLFRYRKYEKKKTLSYDKNMNIIFETE